jgi:hypothetical protein
MADDKQKPAAPKYQGVQLVAIRAGFYGNALRDTGAKFNFTGNVLPKWAVEADKAPAVPPKAPPLNGDTKPIDARAAVAKKAKDATDGGSLA